MWEWCTYTHISLHPRLMETEGWVNLRTRLSYLCTSPLHCYTRLCTICNSLLSIMTETAHPIYTVCSYMFTANGLDNFCLVYR